MTDPTTRIGQYAGASRGLVSQAGAILLKANDRISKGTFSTEQWAKSAQEMFNLFLTAGLNMDPQACLQQLCGEADLSDFITVAPDNACERSLSVAQSFVQDGSPGYRIPDQFIVFVPAILPVYAKRYRVGVNWPDVRSGTYRGRVRLTSLQTATPNVVEMDVIVDL
jgi:hypothetical protein